MKPPISAFTFNFLMISVALNIFFAGANLNGIVMLENGGKMPVLAPGYSGIQTERHFYYDNLDDVNFSIISDIIPINNYRSSIGDVVMLGGLLFFFASSFLMIRKYRRLSNESVH